MDEESIFGKAITERVSIHANDTPILFSKESNGCASNSASRAGNQKSFIFHSLIHQMEFPNHPANSGLYSNAHAPTPQGWSWSYAARAKHYPSSTVDYPMEAARLQRHPMPLPRDA